MKKREIVLNDGTKVVGDEFDENDFQLLKVIFKKWQDINHDLKKLGGRNLNVPDVFSEALFCIFFNSIRTNGTAYSYDCVRLDNHAGVQVKSASIKNDCTSFGPTSTWDELYFVDFAPSGHVDGRVYFYRIDIDFSKLVLNKEKNETFVDQQKQGRRPRFSIKKAIIEPYKLEPCLKINLLENENE